MKKTKLFREKLPKHLNALVEPFEQFAKTLGYEVVVVTNKAVYRKKKRKKS